MLEVQDLRVAYGPIEAVKGLSLRLGAGRLVAIVGANGAGKSTAIRAISGEVPVAGGRITLGSEAIVGLPAHEIARRGLIQCPEGRRVFGGLTVLENLAMGAYGRGLGKRSAATLERVFALFPRLAERRRQLAGTLSGGEQQMLAIGRAINESGTAVLLVEQNAFVALRTASYGYVLQTGRVVMEGDARTLLEDEQMMRAYLG